jgi:HEAT repeat protein
VDALLAQLRDPDPQVRRDAMLKLGEAAGAHASCESAAHALPALQAAAARDPAPACRKAALAALRRAGDRARFNAAVRRALHDDDPLVRLDAAWQVRQAGPSNPAIVDALVRAAEREAELPVAFGMVAGALGSLGDPRAFRPLVAYLASPDGYRRAAAAQALGTLGDPRAIPHLTLLLDDRAAAWQEDHGPARTVADVARAALRRLGVS